MKKHTIIYLILIILSLVLLVGYETLDNLRTDTAAPKITVDESILEIPTLSGEDALLQGVSAWDNVDGDVTASLVVESVRLANSDGTVAVSYAAFDRAGNVAKASRNLRVADYESPKFSLSRSLTFPSGREQNLFSYISAQDAMDGNISHRIRATTLSSTALSNPGIHEVEFRVSNSLGDTAKLVVAVEIYNGTPYDATLYLTDYIVYLNEGESFSPNRYLKELVAGASVISLTGGLPQGINVQTTGTVDTQTPGTYPVAYLVTQTLENGRRYSGYARMTVVVED